MILKTYAILIECANCGASNQMNVQRGITVRAALKNASSVHDDGPACFNCGCSTLDPDQVESIITVGG